ncbi:hypothetical protein BKA65DRAFT_415280 [Rhexocercosporidium sp. MPI-PUGE-AT-0058]|nr:hypothetical protein BKA65DRAFT_415280 [Rhexocercosporidium sp. MPI-PUGE-AT-0058]
MFIAKLFLVAALSSSVLASPITPRNSIKQWEFSGIPPSKDLVWYPCNGDFFCAMLDVPLDYLKPKLGRAYIPLAKYPATTMPYKGMALTNPGGPGVSGVQFLEGYATRLLVPVIGSNYDVVSWDPRGVNNSIPLADCKLSSNLTGSSTAPQLLRRELDKLDGPVLSQDVFEEYYAQTQEVAEGCGAAIGGPLDAGPHMTTATVARDMISIIDAFQKSHEGKKCGDRGLLNYWGFSYGAFLGQTFASMFPHRVGKVVLDGVVDADEWIKYTGRNLINDADATFSTFFLYCHLAGPSACAFYKGTTPHDIFLRFENIVTQLDPVVAYANNWTNATAIELLLLSMKSILFSNSYEPIFTFPSIAYGLVAVESVLPDLTLEKLDILEKKLGLNTTASVSDEILWGEATTCSDVGDVVKGNSLESFQGKIEEFEQVSFLAGESRVVGSFPCVFWNITSDDRFTGPFGGKTKNPILFVSNTLDPITPIYKFVSLLYFSFSPFP